MWRSSRRRPNSQTAATTPRAIISPYALSDSGPSSRRPDDGLGMLASTPVIARSWPRDAPGEARRLDVEHVAVEVERRHVVAALEPAVVDVAAVTGGEELALARVDDVVLA